MLILIVNSPLRSICALREKAADSLICTAYTYISDSIDWMLILRSQMKLVTLTIYVIIALEEMSCLSTSVLQSLVFVQYFGF